MMSITAIKTWWNKASASARKAFKNVINAPQTLNTWDEVAIKVTNKMKEASDFVAAQTAKTAKSKYPVGYYIAAAVIIVLAMVTIVNWLGGCVPSSGATTPTTPTVVVVAETAEKEAAEEVGKEAEESPVEEVSEEGVEIVVPEEVMGLMPITRDSGYEVFASVSRTGTFEPMWPDGTDQTSVGYSNPEEYPDGRTFMTRSQTNEGEIIAFVAQCVSVNEADRLCQSDEAVAIVGLVIGHVEGEYPVKLWDAEFKTLTFHGGGIDEWRAYIYELATFISANKSGGQVEILGPAN